VDKSTIFADSLLEATSILPWKGGLIVTAAPNIFYLRDTDGDGRADAKEMLFSGFFKNNPEAQITNLRFSIDNWIYASNFGQEGTVTSALNPAAPALSMSGADFRFRMDRGQFEAETGPTQFGQTIDDWGHRFLTENSIHIQQAVIPWRYLHRHPYLPFYRMIKNISDHDPLMYNASSPPYWRVERTKRRNQAFQEHHLNQVEYAEGHFTGASGTTIYLADAFPEKYYGNIFIGDVSGNLVHRDVLITVADSVVSVAKRDDVEKNKEFLTSTDPWFRPDNFTVGPDGALYIMDMYRQHIESPSSIPEDLKSDMDYDNGKDKGRIYRVVPKNAGPNKKTFPDLRNASIEQVVAQLSNPSQWWRLQAQRLLLERQDKSAVPALKDLFATSQDPRVRLHALYALEGLNSLDSKITERAMKDPHPGVRESGIILSEKYPECLRSLMEHINDSSARVALQATLSLGEFPAEQVVPALASVIEKHGENNWFRIAVLSSEAGSSLPLLELLLKRDLFFSASKSEWAAFLGDFSYVIGARNREGEIAGLLKVLSTADLKKERGLRLAGLTGLARGMKKPEHKIHADIQLKEALKNMEADPSNEIKAAISEISKLLE
jgi:putative membrane-bound dehydrogenase-like protein